MEFVVELGPSLKPIAAVRTNLRAPLMNPLVQPAPLVSILSWAVAAAVPKSLRSYYSSHAPVSQGASSNVMTAITF